MEELKMKRNIMCIDLKSFFASCECVDRGLDPSLTVSYTKYVFNLDKI